MIGSVAQTAGYFAIWAAATGHFRPQYWMLLLFAIVGSSNTATQDAACIATGIRNFPNYRGHVAGAVPSRATLLPNTARHVKREPCWEAGCSTHHYLCCFCTKRLTPSISGLLIHKQRR